MRRKAARTMALRTFVLVLALPVGACSAPAQDSKTPYASMAPLENYLMERNAEVALARSAGPETIAKDSDVMVLGPHGYEAAVKGKNGFVCMVLRSWTSPYDDPDFWNPKVLSPICLNAPAARSFLPYTIKKTELALAGRTRDQIRDGVKAALDKKDLPAMEIGSMCYMMSKQGHLNDRDGHWHPHLMFFMPLMDPDVWGSEAPDSPLAAYKDTEDGLTIFMLPVGTWSDGTADAGHDH